MNEESSDSSSESSSSGSDSGESTRCSNTDAESEPGQRNSVEYDEKGEPIDDPWCDAHRRNEAPDPNDEPPYPQWPPEAPQTPYPSFGCEYEDGEFDFVHSRVPPNASQEFPAPDFGAHVNEELKEKIRSSNSETFPFLDVFFHFLPEKAFKKCAKWTHKNFKSQHPAYKRYPSRRRESEWTKPTGREFLIWICLVAATGVAGLKSYERAWSKKRLFRRCVQLF